MIVTFDYPPSHAAEIAHALPTIQLAIEDRIFSVIDDGETFVAQQHAKLSDFAQSDAPDYFMAESHLQHYFHVDIFLQSMALAIFSFLETRITRLIAHQTTTDQGLICDLIFDCSPPIKPPYNFKQIHERLEEYYFLETKKFPAYQILEELLLVCNTIKHGDSAAKKLFDKHEFLFRKKRIYRDGYYSHMWGWTSKDIRKYLHTPEDKQDQVHMELWEKYKTISNFDESSVPEYKYLELSKPDIQKYLDAVATFFETIRHQVHQNNIKARNILRTVEHKLGKNADAESLAVACRTALAPEFPTQELLKKCSSAK